MKAIYKYSALLWDICIVFALLLLLFLPWQHWFDDAVQLSRAFQPLSWAHPLGTDELGRDNWLRAVNSLRSTLPWIWLGIMCGSLVGLGLGLIRLASQLGPWSHRLIAVFELVASGLHGVPLPVLAFFAMVIFHGQGLATLVLSLAVMIAFRFYFFVKLNYQRSAKLGYWQVHECLGGSKMDRVWNYGMKAEWRAELGQSVAFYLKAGLITEISLSYLGFGVQEPQASFGNLLGSQLRSFFNGDWGLLFGALALIALACEAPYSLLRLLNEWPAILRGRLLQNPQHLAEHLALEKIQSRIDA